MHEDHGADTAEMPDECVRQCTRCGKLLPVSDFSWKRRARGERHRVCRTCQREVSAAHYERTNATYKARAATRNAVARRDARVALAEFLSSQRCTACGLTRGLQAWVQVRGRLRNASDLVRMGVAWPRIQVLVQTGEVICLGCLASRRREH